MNIKLGYEIGTGKEVSISPSHLIVTGITQQSGKTTTLEGLISRSNLKAIVFKTKPGEKSFTAGTTVAPFFRDRSDFEFVRSLIEAYSREKLVIEKGTLMNICKGSKSLVDIKLRLDNELATGKLRGIKEEIYTRLQHYLENLIPQIQYANFSSVLNIVDGINIMDLERFSDEAQSLIIRSVADEVLKSCHDTIIVIPEAWKFIPQRYNNPCKKAVESYVRQGATNGNFIWIDSQDMSGVDKLPLKQISIWILGYQAERNEVQHTLDQISLPKKQKPMEDEIMKLSIGEFYLSSREEVVKVYVQPSWLSDDQAWKISTGKLSRDEAILSKPLPSLNIPTAKPQPKTDNSFVTKKELAELRIDFFNKIETTFSDIQNYLNNLPQHEPQQIDTDHIVSLVLQKMPSKSTAHPQVATPNIESIVLEVLKRIPKSNGAITYEVAPMEKIKKDFLQKANDKIVEDAASLSVNAKMVLKYIEASGKGVKANELVTKCFMQSSNGAAANKANDAAKELLAKEMITKDTAGFHRPSLKNKISSLLGANHATDQEINLCYDHILASLID